MTIPVVDLADFRCNNPSIKQIVVNEGDMLQRPTSNKVLFTTYRSINPPKVLWHTSRFSIPIFLHPIENMPLIFLDGYITTDTPKHDEHITTSEYINVLFREIDLKK